MNKLKKIASIRQKLSEGGVSVGSWMQFNDSNVAEIMGASGYDWVAIDMEHGSIGLNDIPNISRALELGNTLPFIRLPSADPKFCKQALDAGGSGVIVPMIQTANELIELRSQCYWPPSGGRGVGYSRANLYGKNFEGYKCEANSTFFIPMIENKSALDNLEEILEVDGVDAIFVGPYDLSASMGITGQFEDDEFKCSLKKILDLCNKRQIPAGIHVVQPNQAELNLRIDQGFRFIAYSIDACFLYNASLFKGG